MAGYQKILVLLDLSDSSEQVARAAARIAARDGGELIALHVVEFIPVEPLGESPMPGPEMAADLVMRSRERLADLVEQLGLPRTTCLVLSGNTKAEILRAAAESAVDLIVLGSRERHGLAILVNFTEDTVLHAAPCDVLAIRLK